jgi:hypothetical protein
MDTLLIYLCILMCDGLSIWIVRECIVSDADQNLPNSDKIHRAIWARTGLKRGEMSRAWRTHQKFFPNSPLRALYIALWAFGVCWMFFGIAFLTPLTNQRRQ